MTNDDNERTQDDVQCERMLTSHGKHIDNHHHCLFAAMRYHIVCATAPSSGGFEAPFEFMRSKLT